VSSSVDIDPFADGVTVHWGGQLTAAGRIERHATTLPGQARQESKRPRRGIIRGTAGPMDGALTGTLRRLGASSYRLADISGVHGAPRREGVARARRGTTHDDRPPEMENEREAAAFGVAFETPSVAASRAPRPSGSRRRVVGHRPR
jgi:hypothetical protein